MSWKNDFLELFCLNNNLSNQKAFDLKKQKMPRKLYRYRSLPRDTDKKEIHRDSFENRHSEIVDGKLYLVHPNKLNDTFEASTLMEDDWIKYVNIDRYNSILEDFPKDDASDALNNIQDLTKKIAETTSVKDIETMKSFLLEDINDTIKENYTVINNISQNNVRLCCFTIKNNNIPMWYNYTDGHQGICLEYDTNKIPPNIQSHLFPVQYVKNLPDIRKCNEMCSLLLYFLTMHKMYDWRYEQEWRLIYTLGDFSDKPIGKNTDGFLVDFIQPSKIILGTTISKDNKNKIIEFGKEANIPVVQSIKTIRGLEFEPYTDV